MLTDAYKLVPKFNLGQIGQLWHKRGYAPPKVDYNGNAGISSLRTLDSLKPAVVWPTRTAVVNAYTGAGSSYTFYGTNTLPLTDNGNPLQSQGI